MNLLTPELKNTLSRTPEGRKILLTLSGTRPVFLGKGKNIFQKIGKYTSKITGTIAKVAAGMVGIPPGAIDALAKVDPAAHKNLMDTIIKSNAGQQAAAIIAKQQEAEAAKQEQPGNLFSTIKPVYIVAGAAGLAIIIVLISKKKKG